MIVDTLTAGIATIPSGDWSHPHSSRDPVPAGELWDMEDELRLARASLLYADTVLLDSTRLGLVTAAFIGEEEPFISSRLFEKDFIDEALSRQPPYGNKWPDEILVRRWASQLAELAVAYRAGVLERARFVRKLDEFPALLPVLDNNFPRWSPFRSRRTPALAEGRLVASVLAQLPAFPDASLDAILDLRERLTPQRIRLRGALAAAALQLASVEPNHMDTAIAELARREIDPTLADIDAALDELGARPTLYRVASSKEAVAAAATSALIVAAGHVGPVDLEALAHSLAAAPMLAAVTRELAARRSIIREVALRPYCLLHPTAPRRRL